jgi:MFS family permease
VFILNGLSFVGTWLVIYRWRREANTDSGPAENFSGALRAGIRYVQYSPAIVAVLVRSFAFSFGASAMWALLSVVVARRLHLQSGSYAVMLSWLGAGAVSGAFLIGKIGHRLNLNRRVLLGSFVFVGTNLALALVPGEYWLFPVMFISGTAWLITMTSFSTSVQLHVPRWVQARVVSVYMLTFQAGLSLGSIVWGELADRLNVSLALLVAAGWMLASLALALFFPMHQPEGLDFSPAEPWSDQLPALEAEIDPDDGPVVVMIEYDVAPANHEAFRLAARQLTRLRLRDGALRAGVFTDVAQPTRITEFFYVATWAEHERQHHRFTRDDQQVEAEVRRFHRGEAPPHVTHFLAFPRTPNVEVAAPPLAVAGSAQ